MLAREPLSAMLSADGQSAAYLEAAGSGPHAATVFCGSR